MLDYGTTDDHTNVSEFADDDRIEAPTPTNYSVAFFFRFRNTMANFRNPWSKIESGVAGYGMEVRNQSGSSDDEFRTRHTKVTGGAASDTTEMVISPGFPDTETHSLVVTWDGSNHRYYLDGALHTTNAFTGNSVVEDSGVGLNLGNNDTHDNGAPIALGHFMLWINTVLTVVDVAQYNDGKTIPRASKLTYWIPGTENPPIEKLTQVTATNSGTVALLADSVDAFFQGEPLVPAYREIASRILRRDRFPAPVYKVPAGPEMADLEIGNFVSLAHWGTPRAESLIVDREVDQMTETGQGILGYVTGITYNPASLQHTIEVEDFELSLHSFWSTFKMPDGTEDNRSGIAERNIGATKTFTRDQSAWIPQSDGKLARIGPGVEKFNHQGIWLEKERANLVLNSNFHDTSITTIWTSTIVNGGATAEETDPALLLFRDSVLYPRIAKITFGTSGFTSLKQTFAVLTADGDHKAQFWTRTDTGVETPRWRLQRSSDSFFFNNGTGAWQSVNIVNGLPTSAAWTQTFSNRIPVSSNQNWTLEIGINTGTAGDIVYFGQIDTQNSAYNASPIVTDQFTALIQPEDFLSYEILGDATRQIAFADRHTMRMTYTALQDSNLMTPDEEVLGIWFHTWDTFASQQDILSVRYRVDLGVINPRFELLARLNGGSNTVVAFIEAQLIFGQEYQIAVILDGTKATLFVDGVWQDAVLSDVFPNTEADTFMVIAQGGAGIIADLEVIPRVLTSEEILAYR